MNKILINNKIFYLICSWRKNKNISEYDADNNEIPYPVEINDWKTNISDDDFFIDNLIKLESILNKQKYYEKLPSENCLICKDKDIGNKKYILKKYIWNDNLKHYIKKHNIKIPEEFIDFIYENLNDNLTNKKIKKVVRLNGKHKFDDKYVKIKSNQLLILDALMEHGGYSKKYLGKGTSRYSEHAGVLDFHNEGLNKIIVSGNTTRVDRGDEEIFLPHDLSDIVEYEYLFHTHPPTPKPGGRADLGILYEFPSLGDILHFTDKYDEGVTIGSIVMTPEGLYNIRCLSNNKKFNLDEQKENKLYKEITKEIMNLQYEAIEKYGTSFTTENFYKTIAQDKYYIGKINEKLEKYNIFIDYFPRKKNEFDKWIVSDIHLKI